MIIPAKLIKSAEKNPTAKPSDHLSLVLSQVQSSHEPVFIMDNGKLEGIVYASYALFKKRFPLSTKASHAMRKVPKIKQETTLFEVARHMLSMDVYVLPVFGVYGDVLGVIKALDILDYVKEDSKMFKNLEVDDIITKSAHDRVRDVYKSLKSDKSSRIVLVDEKILNVETNAKGVKKES